MSAPNRLSIKLQRCRIIDCGRRASAALAWDGYWSFYCEEHALEKAVHYGKEIHDWKVA